MKEHLPSDEYAVHYTISVCEKKSEEINKIMKKIDKKQNEEEKKESEKCLD